MIKKNSRKKKFSSGAVSAVASTTAAAFVLTLAPADASPTQVLDEIRDSQEHRVGSSRR